MILILTWCFLVKFVLVISKEVCYHPYGCFHDDAPYNRALGRLPEAPYAIHTRFTLHTRKRQNAYINPLAAKSPSGAEFHPNKTTIFIVHGYIENKGQWWVQLLIDELLKFEDMNVVFVDWSGGSGFPYHQAYGNARLVGRQMAMMVEVIKNDTGINWPKLRFISFSLGCHVAGYAGRTLRERGLLVPHITALDAAGPMYEYQHPDTRIDASDAEFVDAMHTDTHTLVILGFGTVQRFGHIDFYPNGGYAQHGCEKFDIGIVQYLACSHYRALRYFIESINSNQCIYRGYPCASFEDFEANKCGCPAEGCPVMGYHVKKRKTRTKLKHYLNTNTEFPFCAVHYKVRFNTGDRYFAAFSGVVTIKITGVSGTEEIDLPSTSYESSKSTVLMIIRRKELGKLMYVEIIHNGIIDIWYLQSMSITHMSSSTEYTACYKMWLNNSDNKRKLMVGPNTLCNNNVS